MKLGLKANGQEAKRATPNQKMAAAK